MKKQLVIIAALATTAASVFGQGYVTLSTSTHRLVDEFTTPGVQAYGATIDYALYWAPVGTTDPLTAQGTEFGLGAGAAVQQVATNGVTSISQAAGGSLNAQLTAAGFTLGLNSGNPAVGTTLSASQSGYGQFQLGGTAAGSTYEMIVVGWNAAAGLSAITGGTYSAIGWSNPFNYITGSSATDPNGTLNISSVGYMNQFGVASVVPEPTTLALAGLSGASLLLFRRKK
jgi:hypothetical protein